LLPADDFKEKNSHHSYRLKINSTPGTVSAIHADGNRELAKQSGSRRVSVIVERHGWLALEPCR
jgi:hypothetical protein